MASGPSITAPASDPLGSPTRSEAPQHENGDTRLSKPAENSTLTKPPETKSAGNSTPANGISNESVPETKPNQFNTGDKRDLETTATTKSNAEESAEPSSKRQKPGEGHTGAANGASVSEKAEPSQTAPEKKKGGRPRKTKDSVKKDIPTDGIGSRTRSRTKPVS